MPNFLKVRLSTLCRQLSLSKTDSLFHKFCNNGVIGVQSKVLSVSESACCMKLRCLHVNIKYDVKLERGYRYLNHIIVYLVAKFLLV